MTKRYLNLDDVAKHTEYVIYDKKVEEAIIRFQNDAKITIDGKVGNQTISRLSDWNAENTTLVLGVRAIILNISGDDINELLRLLIKAGVAPKPKNVKYDAKGKAIFTLEMAESVEKFQKKYGFEETGNVDAITLAKLKAL